MTLPILNPACLALKHLNSANTETSRNGITGHRVLKNLPLVPTSKAEVYMPATAMLLWQLLLFHLCIYPLTHNICLRVYDVPETILDTGNLAVKKTKQQQQNPEKAPALRNLHANGVFEMWILI